MSIASDNSTSERQGFDLNHPDVIGKRVVVVEDDAITAQMIMAVLREMKLEPAGPYATAAAVWEALSDCPADLVIMDIGIEGEQDGVDTAAMLREQFQVPVMFLTGASDPKTEERARRVEPLGYLLKPFKQAVLRNAVEMAFWRDMAERKLREREMWFTATLNTLDDAIVTTDQNGFITHMNARAEVLLAKTFAAVEGSRVIDLIKLKEFASGEAIDLLAKMHAARTSDGGVERSAVLQPVGASNVIAMTYVISELKQPHTAHINTPLGYAFMLREA